MLLLSAERGGMMANEKIGARRRRRWLIFDVVLAVFLILVGTWAIRNPPNPQEVEPVEAVEEPTSPPTDRRLRLTMLGNPQGLSSIFFFIVFLDSLF